MTSAAIRELRKNFPDAHITLVVRKAVYPLAELCPYVNEVLIFPVDDIKNILTANGICHMIAAGLEMSLNHFWKRRYDLAFQLGVEGFVHLRSLMIYLSGAKNRIGIIREPLDKFFYTHPLSINSNKLIHENLRTLYILSAVGLKVEKNDIEVWFNGADLYTARQFLGNFGEGRIKVAVGIGSQNASRKYPVEKYLVAFKEIIEKGASLIIIGGPSELDDAKFLEENLPAEFVKNIVKFKPDYRVTAAAISLADIYLGNDTGTQHIAAAFKKPVIMVSRVAKDRRKVFPNVVPDLEVFYPWRTESIVIRPSHQLEGCREHPNWTGCVADKPHCITQIEPSEIVRAFDDMIYFKKTIRFKEC